METATVVVVVGSALVVVVGSVVVVVVASLRSSEMRLASAASVVKVALQVDWRMPLATEPSANTQMPMGSLTAVVLVVLDETVVVDEVDC